MDRIRASESKLEESKQSTTLFRAFSVCLLLPRSVCCPSQDRVMKFTSANERTIRWKIAGHWEGDPKKNGKLKRWDVLKEEEDVGSDGSSNQDNQLHRLDPGMPLRE